MLIIVLIGHRSVFFVQRKHVDDGVGDKVLETKEKLLELYYYLTKNLESISSKTQTETDHRQTTVGQRKEVQRKSKNEPQKASDVDIDEILTNIFTSIANYMECVQ